MKKNISAGGYPHLPYGLGRSFFLLSCLIPGFFSQAQIVKWTNTGTATGWYTAANWTPATPAGAWLPSNIAQFNNSGTATTAGINMSMGSLSIGAIEVTGARTRNLTIGNSSTTAGSLQLNGAVVNGMANVILDCPGNSVTKTLYLQDNETGKGKKMSIILGNAKTNIVHMNGVGGAITINSVIIGDGKKLTLLGEGSGGTLTLNAANTYSGLTTVAIRAGYLVLSHLGGGTLPSSNDVLIEDGGLRIQSNQTLRNVELKTLGSLTVTDGVTLTVTGTFTQYGGGISLGSSGTGKIVYAPGANLVYGAVGAVNTGNEFPAVNGPENVICKASIVSLQASRTIPGTLTLNNSSVYLNANDFTASAITTINSTTISRVVTSGAGRLIINNIGTAPVTFPVANTWTSYNPVTISNGQGLNYAVRVENTIAPPILINANAVNRTWYITPSGAPSATPVNVSFYYTCADVNAGFNVSTPVQLGMYSSAWGVVQNNIPQIIPLPTSISTLVASTQNPFVIGNVGAIQ